MIRRPAKCLGEQVTIHVLTSPRSSLGSPNDEPPTCASTGRDKAVRWGDGHTVNILAMLQRRQAGLIIACEGPQAHMTVTTSRGEEPTCKLH